MVYNNYNFRTIYCYFTIFLYWIIILYHINIPVKVLKFNEKKRYCIVMVYSNVNYNTILYEVLYYYTIF